MLKNYRQLFREMLTEKVGTTSKKCWRKKCCNIF
jgi:hypothetical protein